MSIPIVQPVKTPLLYGKLHEHIIATKLCGVIDHLSGRIGFSFLLAVAPCVVEENWLAIHDYVY